MFHFVKFVYEHRRIENRNRKKVFETDDENLLSELDALLSTNEKFVFEDLPKHIQEGIKRGTKQAEEGKLIPFDEVKKGFLKDGVNGILFRRSLRRFFLYLILRRKVG